MLNTIVAIDQSVTTSACVASVVLHLSGPLQEGAGMVGLAHCKITDKVPKRAEPAIAVYDPP